MNLELSAIKTTNWQKLHSACKQGLDDQAMRIRPEGENQFSTDKVLI